MIAVYDNGEAYSDHSIYFVEVENALQAEQLADVVGWHLELVADGVTWYEGDAMPAQEFAVIHCYRENALVQIEKIRRMVSKELAIQCAKSLCRRLRDIDNKLGCRSDDADKLEQWIAEAQKCDE